MDCTKTSPKRVYRRRQPEKSVLYRALAQHFESFLLLYEQRFEKSYARFVIMQSLPAEPGSWGGPATFNYA